MPSLPRAPTKRRRSENGKKEGKPFAPPRLTFFVGKGGVGKTTISAAFAVQQAARRGQKVILVSSDPAHSLADVLALKLGSAPRAIPGKLTVWQIDAQREFRKFLNDNRTALVESLEKGTLFTAQELNSFLDATFPGMAEVGALLALHTLLRSAGEFTHIVVDTAPFGHTLRLFQIPEQLKKLLELIKLAEQRDAVLAQSFGGHIAAGREDSGILRKLERMLEGIRAALNPENAEMVLVTTPEKFSLQEARRVSEELKRNPVPMSFGRIVLNRAVRNAGKCKPCATRAHKTEQALAFLKKHFPRAPRLLAKDSGAPLIGMKALAGFGRHVFQGARLAPVSVGRAASAQRALPLRPAEWPPVETALTFALGKGGVGKTTVSAATAFRARQGASSGKAVRSKSGAEVTICSTDPAPSLDDIFQTEVGRQPGSVLGDPGLFAVEADSVALLKAWTQRLEQRLRRFVTTEQSGVHVELSFEYDFLRGLLDLVPPGVDEIFATFEILRLLDHDEGEDRKRDDPNRGPRDRKLVIDMAPTGHALELLRTPERLLHWSRLLLKALSGQRQLGMAQEIAVELAEVSQQATRLLRLMHERRQSQVLVVMLAEFLPDRETQRLLEQLEELKLIPAAVFVNRVIMNPSPGCRRCQSAAASQCATLAGLKRRMKDVPLYILPEMADEPVGRTGLNRLIESLKAPGK